MNISEFFLALSVVFGTASMLIFLLLVVLPSIKEFFKLSIYNIRLVQHNGRYYIRRGYFFYYQYYWFSSREVYKKKWFQKSATVGAFRWDFSTTDKVKALKTYHEIRSKHLEKLENPDKEVIIK